MSRRTGNGITILGNYQKLVLFDSNLFVIAHPKAQQQRAHSMPSANAPSLRWCRSRLLHVCSPKQNSSEFRFNYRYFIVWELAGY